jgi:hypothetical protein
MRALLLLLQDQRRKERDAKLDKDAKERRAQLNNMVKLTSWRRALVVVELAPPR